MMTSRSRRLNPSPPVALKMSCAVDPINETIQTTTRKRIRTPTSLLTMTNTSRTLAMGLFLFLSLHCTTGASSAAVSVSATASVVSSARSISNGSNYTTAYQSKQSQSSLTSNDDSVEPLKQTKKKKRKRTKKQPVHSTTAAAPVTPEDFSAVTDLPLANSGTAAASERQHIAATATCLLNNVTTTKTTTTANTNSRTAAKKHKKKRQTRKVPPGSGSTGAPNTSSVVAAKATDASSMDVPAATVAVEPRKHVSRPKTSKTTKTKATTTTANTPVPLSREAASSLRRIQGEWKDAVQAGIAFDWKKGKSVSRRRTSRHNTSTSTSTTDNAQQQQQQHVWVGPLSKNIWIWHFSVTGVPGSVFGDGIYHGRIILPSNYPAQPPRIQVWTPSGRFIPRADICLSASNYHPESWSASWTIRTLVEALRLHMITPAQEIGGLTSSYEERLAKVAASRSWRCRVSPSIIVDHAHMVAQGLFPEPVVVAVAIAEDDLSESDQQQEGTSAASETTATVEIALHKRQSKSKQEPHKLVSKQKRRRKQAPGSGRPATATIPLENTLPVAAVPSLLTSIHRILFSPVRLTLLGFAVLFFVLNRS